MKLGYIFLISTLFLLLGCEESKRETKPKKEEKIVYAADDPRSDPNFGKYVDIRDNPEYKMLKKRYTKMDERLKAYKDAKYWFRDAYEDYGSSYNLGVTYMSKIKDYKEAWYWFRTSWNLKAGYDTALNIGFSYQKLDEKEKALEWYLKSWKGKETGQAANNIGLLYANEFKNKEKALEWYKKALEKENLSVLSNLSAFYYKEGEKIKAAAYSIANLSDASDKELEIAKTVILKHLREEFKLDDETIKKGYELQLTLEGLPKRYKGNLFE